MATSELNQFLETVDEKVLECTICYRRLRNPKSLNCFHSFCLTCLEDWVNTKGKLTCPTCSKSYDIPQGGLQKLPPNIFLNNLLETIEKISKRDQMKCVCTKGQAIYYCQECRHYLCSTCSHHHKILPITANHKLHTVEDVRSMTPQDFAALHPPMCSLHNKPLEFYCTDCKTPICINCTVMDHRAWEGKHKPINISEAFQSFKKTAKKLEKAAYQCETQLQDELKAATQYATKLELSKDTSLRDIDNHVQLMINKIMENGDKMKNEVQTIYKKKKKVNDAQISELKVTISDLNTKLSFLNQLLKSDEATALQSSETIIKALNDRIKELPKTQPSDNRQIKFLINEQQIASLKQCNIGNVKEMSEIADCLQLKGIESVTQGQTIVVKVMKTDECEIHANQLKATWTQPTGETNKTQVKEDDNGDYFVTGKCTRPGIYKLDVIAYGEPIRQSPMVINVEKAGLVNTIQIPNQETIIDVKCEHDCLLVSCRTNEILKYKQSGEYTGKVRLPQGVAVNKMYKMKDGSIPFSDWDNKCIKICNMNGQLIKSIDKGVLENPYGIHVDEASNTLYVGFTSSVLVYNIDSGQIIRSIGTRGNQEGQVNLVNGIILNNQRNVLVSDFNNNRLQLFDNEGRFMKVLVRAGKENGKVMHPRGVVVDQDDNIIISSEHKIQLFSSDGHFIKRIDKEEDGINHPFGLSIISCPPRRVAVANQGDKTIKIFNY